MLFLDTCDVFKRLGFRGTKVHHCSLYLNDDLTPVCVLGLTIEIKVWTKLRQQTGKAAIHPPPASFEVVWGNNDFLGSRLVFLIEYLQPLNPPPFLWPSFPTNILHFLSVSDIIASHRRPLCNTSDTRRCYVDFGRMLGGARRSASDTRMQKTDHWNFPRRGWMASC